MNRRGDRSDLSRLHPLQGIAQESLAVVVGQVRFFPDLLDLFLAFVVSFHLLLLLDHQFYLVLPLEVLPLIPGHFEIPLIVGLHHVALSQGAFALAFNRENLDEFVQTSSHQQGLIRDCDILD